MPVSRVRKKPKRHRNKSKSKARDAGDIGDLLLPPSGRCDVECGNDWAHRMPCRHGKGPNAD